MYFSQSVLSKKSFGLVKGDSLEVGIGSDVNGLIVVTSNWTNSLKVHSKRDEMK